MTFAVAVETENQVGLVHPDVRVGKGQTIFELLASEDKVL
jgi:hypothetical protein